MLGRQRRVRPSRRQRARAQGASSVEFLILIALLGLGLIAATRSIRDSLFATSGRVGAHVEALTAVDEGGPAPLNSLLDAVLRERDGTSAEDADSDDAADSQDADSDSEPSLLSSL